MCVACRLQHMGDKGWGLVALQPVKAGSFVIEYIGGIPAYIFACDLPHPHIYKLPIGWSTLAGEVVSADQAAERSAAYHQEEQPHTYFMNLRYACTSYLCARLAGRWPVVHTALDVEGVRQTIHRLSPVTGHVARFGVCQTHNSAGAEGAVGVQPLGNH